MDIEELKKLEPLWGSWYVDKEIGKGSFGKVYSIYKDDSGMRFWAALKTISIPTNDSEIQDLDNQGFGFEDKVRYFDNIAAGITGEIRIMYSLRGITNIVCFEDQRTIMHSDGIGRDILIRMELLKPLDVYMKSIHATHYDVVCMLRDIAQALVVCDKRNIIHRDIKPDNIMVSENGDYKLVDFGIARNMERISQASTKAGSYPYMAPEVQMHQPYGKTVDIYSLGIVAYREFNAYRYPFLPPYPLPFTAEERDQALIRRFRGEKLPAIEGLSKQIFSIIEKCTALKPEHRYRSAMELLSDLQKVINLPELKNKPLYDATGYLLIPGGKPVKKSDIHDKADGSGRGSTKGSYLASSRGSTKGSYIGSSLGKSQLGNSQGSHLGSQLGNNGQGSYLGSQLGNGQDSHLGSRLGSNGQGSYLGSQLGNGQGGHPAGPGKGKPDNKKSSSVGKKIVLTVAGIMLVSSASLAFLVLRDQNDQEPTPFPTVSVTQTQPATIPEDDWSQASNAPVNEEKTVYDPVTDRITIECEKCKNGYMNGNVTERNIAFSGQAKAGVKLVVEAKDEKGQTIYGDQNPVTVNSEGKWTWYLPQSKLQDGDKVKVEAHYAEDVLIAPASFEFKVDRACGQIELSDDVTPDSTQVSGRTEPGATVEMRYLTNGVLWEDKGEADETGKFTIKVEHGPLEADSTLMIKATDPAGNEAKLTDRKVGQEVRAKVTAWLNSGNIKKDYLKDEIELTGSARAERDLALYINGRQDKTAEFVYTSNGKYTVKADLTGYGEETLELVVRYADGIGESSDPIEGTHIKPLRAEVRYDGSVVQSGDTLGAKTLSVKLKEKTGLKVKVLLEGNKGSSGEADLRDGAAEFKLNEFKDGESIVLLVSYADVDDSAYRFESVYILDISSSKPRIEQAELTEDTTRITGSAEAGAEVSLSVDGKHMGSKTCDDNGRFVFDGLSLSMDQKVEIRAVDALGNESEPAEITVLRGRLLDPIDIAINPAPTKGSGKEYITRKTPSLRLTGTARKNAKLTVSLNGAGSSVQTDGNGKWECEFNISNLREDEEIHIHAAYADWPGENEKDLHFTLDTECAVRISSEPVPGDQEIDFKADPLAEVTAYVNDRRAGSVKAKEDGTGRITVTRLKGGETIRLEAKDQAGNKNTDEKTVFDPKTYEISINCPQCRDGYLNGSVEDEKITFIGHAKAGMKLSVEVKYGKDGLTKQEVDVGTDGTWEWSIPMSSLRDGDEVKAEARYKDDIQVAPASVVFTVDRACREIELSGSVKTDSTQITGRTESGATVRLRLVGSDFSEEVKADAAGEFIIPVKGLDNGTNFEITATDRAGNEATFSDWVGREERAKVTARVSSGNKNGYLADVIELSGTARAGRKLALYINDVRVKEFAADANGKYTVSADLTMEGRLSMQVRYADGYGESSDPVEGIHIKPLQAEVRYEGKVVQNGETVGAKTLSVKLQLETGLKVNVLLEGNKGSSKKGVIRDGAAECKLDGFKDGETLTLLVYYADFDDSATQFKSSYMIDCFSPKPGIDQAELTEDTTRISGSAEKGSVVSLSVNDQLVNTKTTDDQGRFVFDGLTLRAGQNVKIKATDRFGNISAEESRNVRAWEMIEITGVEPLLKDGLLNGDADSLTLKGSSEKNRKLEYRLNGEKTNETVPAGGAWQWMLPTKNLVPDRQYTLQVQYAGQPDTACTLVFTYDPACSEIKLNAQVIDSETEEISGVTEKRAVVRMRDSSGAVVSSVICGDDGAFSLPLSVGQRKPGTKLSLWAEDPAGNKSDVVDITVSMADREPITINESVFPAKDEAGTLLIAYAPETMDFRGTAQAGMELQITYTVDQGQKQTENITADAYGKWKTSLPLGTKWETAIVRVDYARGDHKQRGREITIRRDNKCELSFAEEYLTENSTTLTVISEQGARLQLRINGKDHGEKVIVGKDPVKFDLPRLNPGDQVGVFAEDRLGNYGLLSLDVKAEKKADNVSTNVSGAERETITVDESPFPISDAAARLMISHAADPLELWGTAQAGEELKITYSADRGRENTETVSVDAVGEWKAALKLGTGWKEAEVSVDYARGDDEQLGTDITILQDNQCELSFEEECLTENSTTLTVYSERGATVQLIVNGNKYGDRVTVGKDPVVLDLPGLNPGDKVEVVAADRLKNEARSGFTVEEEKKPLEVPIAIDEGLFPAKDEAGRLMISKAADPLELWGTAQGGEELEITYSADRGRESTETVSVDAGGEWKAALKLGTDWKEAEVSVDYTRGDDEQLGTEITILQDNQCELSFEEERLTENSTTLTVYTEPGAKVQLIVNGKRYGQEVTAGTGPVKLDLPKLNPDDQVAVSAADRVGNHVWVPVRIEKANEPEEVPAAVTQPEEVPAAVSEPEESPSSVSETGRGSITVDEGLFSAKDEAGRLMISQAADPLELRGAAQAGEVLKITYAVDQGEKQTKTTAANANGEWKASLKLGTDWKEAEVSVDYAQGDDEQLGKEITILQDNQCELTFAEEPLTINSTTLTVYTEPGARVQLIINGKRYGQEVTAGTGPVKLDLPKLNPNDQVAVSAADRVGNRAWVPVRIEEANKPKETPAAVTQPEEVPAAVTQPEESPSAVSETGREPITVDEGLFPAKDEAGRLMISKAADPLELKGSAQAGEILKITYAVDQGEKQTKTTAANANGEWKTSLKLGTDWKEAEVSVDYARGDDEQLGTEITILQDNQCELSFAEEPLTINSTTLTVYTEPGARVQLIVNGKRYGQEVTASSGPVKLDLPKLNPDDQVAVSVTDRVENRAWVPVSIEEANKPKETPAAVIQPEEVPATVSEKDGEPITVNDKKAVKTDYVHEYDHFALGLDAPAMTIFPQNEILMTGWIWTPQGYDISNLGVEIVVDKKKPGFDTQSKEYKDNFSVQIVRRNVSGEHPEYVQKYGRQDTGKGGIAVLIKLSGDLALKPGKHTVKLSFYDKTNVSRSYSFGTYEIIISSDKSVDASFNGTSEMQRRIKEWAAQ